MKAEEETRTKLQLEKENGKLHYVNSSIRTEKCKTLKLKGKMDGVGVDVEPM